MKTISFLILIASLYTIRMYLRFKNQQSTKGDVLFWLMISISGLVFLLVPDQITIKVVTFFKFTHGYEVGTFIIAIYAVLIFHYLLRKIENGQALNNLNQ